MGCRGTLETEQSEEKIIALIFLISKLSYIRWRENSRKVKEKTGKKKND